ncbi:MAG: iron-sulfur cluster assembly accessory protein [Halobacteria archaeon]|nr:iron-sulfur cluster assembly accessory protein [Halobacteria archaeon]
MSDSDTSDELIEMTPDAARKATELLEERGLEGHGIRVGVDYRGGNASYSLEFTDGADEDDIVVESNGVSIYVDSEAAAAVEDARIDYVVENGKAGFKVQPPTEVDEIDFDDSLEGRIHEFLARNFPQIQGHGGEAVIEELDEEEEYVKLSLEGACSGCGISDATADAIRKNMPQRVDGINKVEISAGDDDHIEIDSPF